MTTKDDVEVFLKEFIALAKVLGIVFVRRPENNLIELGISAIIREEMVLALKPENYYRGPSEDRDFPGFYLWEFGIPDSDIGEIYVKLSTRKEGSKKICVSFHRAGYKIDYPFMQ